VITSPKPRNLAQESNGHLTSNEYSSDRTDRAAPAATARGTSTVVGWRAQQFPRGRCTVAPQRDANERPSFRNLSPIVMGAVRERWPERGAVFLTWFMHWREHWLVERTITVRQGWRAAQISWRASLRSGRSTDAGYSRCGAKSVWQITSRLLGLREAIRLSLEQTGRFLVGRPIRKRNRYYRRLLALNVLRYVTADHSGRSQQIPSSTNCMRLGSALRKFRGQESASVAVVPLRGPLEGKDPLVSELSANRRIINLEKLSE